MYSWHPSQGIATVRAITTAHFQYFAMLSFNVPSGRNDHNRHVEPCLLLARNRPLSSNTPPQKSSRLIPAHPRPAPPCHTPPVPPRIHCQPWQRGGAGAGFGERTEVPRPGFARRFPSAGRCCCCGRAIAQRADQAVAERVCGQKPLNGALARATYPILHEALASAPSEACRNGRRADTKPNQTTDRPVA